MAYIIEYKNVHNGEIYVERCSTLKSLRKSIREIHMINGPNLYFNKIRPYDIIGIYEAKKVSDQLLEELMGDVEKIEKFGVISSLRSKLKDKQHTIVSAKKQIEYNRKAIIESHEIISKIKHHISMINNPPKEEDNVVEEAKQEDNKEE